MLQHSQQAEPSPESWRNGTPAPWEMQNPAVGRILGFHFCLSFFIYPGFAWVGQCQLPPGWVHSLAQLSWLLHVPLGKIPSPKILYSYSPIHSWQELVLGRALTFPPAPQGLPPFALWAFPSTEQDSRMGILSLLASTRFSSARHTWIQAEAQTNQATAGECKLLQRAGSNSLGEESLAEAVRSQLSQLSQHSAVCWAIPRQGTDTQSGWAAQTAPDPAQHTQPWLSSTSQKRAAADFMQNWISDCKENIFYQWSRTNLAVWKQIKGELHSKK